MTQSYFPLRWESTGDRWWYASPIDWAAANGHYDLVRELLRLDANLLIKLTSLRRIRRLETVWDDDSRFADAATCRSAVARNLLLECETKNRKNNTLVRAGYGGWLLYTAASAGDVVFVKELLERDPLLVFGEGEYGVTDIFYAAARSKDSEVFRVLFDHAVGPVCGDLVGESGSGFRWEIVNRAVHAAARGGDLEMVREIVVGEGLDVLNCRDVQGATILHAASGKGQVEVVKDLITSYDIINSTDNQGNTALHIAACRGHLPVVKTLITASPSTSSQRNNAGDTFLHMAVAGFRTPGFQRLDHQMELMEDLVSGTIVKIHEIINLRNNNGRTALHIALIGNVHSDLVGLLMTVRSIDLNVRDVEGMTPLDLLSERPRSVSSEILIKQLVSAGGITNSKDHAVKFAIANRQKLQGIGSSPGTSFKISDAKILLYAGVETSEASGSESSCSSSSKSEKEKHNSVKSAATRLKYLLGWSRQKEKAADDESVASMKKWCEREDTPSPLRHQFSKPIALSNNKRILAVRNSVPSEKLKGICLEEETDGASCSNSNLSKGGEMAKKLTKKTGSGSRRLMNQYFCFGAEGLAVEDSVRGQVSRRMFKQSTVSVS